MAAGVARSLVPSQSVAGNSTALRTRRRITSSKAKSDRQGVPLAGKLLRVRPFLLAWLDEHKARNDRGIKPRTVKELPLLDRRHLAHECDDKCPVSCRLGSDSIGRVVLASSNSDIERLLGREARRGAESAHGRLHVAVAPHSSALRDEAWLDRPQRRDPCGPGQRVAIAQPHRTLVAQANPNLLGHVRSNRLGDS